MVLFRIVDDNMTYWNNLVRLFIRFYGIPIGYSITCFLIYHILFHNTCNFLIYHIRYIILCKSHLVSHHHHCHCCILAVRNEMIRIFDNVKPNEYQLYLVLLHKII